MIMFNNEIPRWRNAVTNAHDGILRSKLHFIGVNRAPTLSIQKLENAQMNEAAPQNGPQDEKITTSKSPTAKGSKTSVTTCVTAEGPSEPNKTNSEVTVDMPEESEPITVIEAPRRNSSHSKKKPSRIVITTDDNSQWETFDPSVCDSSYQWLHRETKKSAQQARKCVSDSSNSGLFTELTDEDGSKTESAKSVRCGYHSVSTLRSRLEAKIRGNVSRRSTRTAKKRSPVLTQVKEASTKSLPSIEELLPKSRPAIVITPATPVERLRLAGRSQSETECSTRINKEKPAVTSYDDSLLDIPQSERISYPKRQNEDWRNMPLDKYNQNQWWAQPLRV
ncbi:unnamed protein product [Strongylus vulgaris]|uniref:Uncharacterized protein n=1 Tax=Strongylus vulgaris TaxID=40348 RepID=A0A3P7KUT0_STRVU|nr:unnamed protein product [Strongylus vulgaris]